MSESDYSMPTGDSEVFEYQMSDVFDTTAIKVVHNPDRDPNDVDPEAFMPPLPEQMATSQFCDEMQLKAVKHIVVSSRPLSDAAWEPLLDRVLKMKFTEAQLKRCLRYIRDEAPIIIHVKLDQNDRLEKMLHDTHYRNQFETKSSNGSYDANHSQRKSWEDRLFNSVYHDATPFQRPKYGCLNIVRDPQGIKSAYYYGDSYFVLRLVRLRCSFTDQDSGNSNAELSSCEYYAHVLLRYNDSELKGVMEVANGVKPYLDSSCISNYKEVQFHGELPFDRVLEKVMVNPRHKSDAAMTKRLKAFCEKNNCTYEYF
eukprot:PhM_4_TR3627/c0_g1_i1/m.84077